MGMSATIAGVVYGAWLVMFMTYGRLDDYVTERTYDNGFGIGLLRFVRSLIKPAVAVVAVVLLWQASLFFGWIGRGIMIVVCIALCFIPLGSYSAKWRWAANALIAIVFALFLCVTHVLYPL